MAIFYEEKTKCFRLKTDASEYQIKVSEIGILQHLYYGRDTCGNDMDYRIVPIDRGFSGNPYECGDMRGISLDTLPQEFTGDNVGDYRVSAMSVISENGSRSCDLRYVSHTIRSGREAVPGLPYVRQNQDEVETLSVLLSDALVGIEVELIYSVFAKKNVIARRTVVTNTGAADVRLEKAASVCIDFPYGSWDLIHFHGRHCMERQMERTEVTHGIRTLESRRGMSSHQENPFVILCERDATEYAGDCYGFMLMYSGNHRTQVERSQADSTRLVMGINDEGFSWRLGAGESFFAPEAILSYSSEGLSRLSHNYHTVIRENVCDPRYRKLRRPVLVNNWEATYFDFDKDKILRLARSAAELGIEMLVLDDGWFGKRDSDKSGLGDWYVNESKLAGGMKALSDEIHALGLKFGLWMEPEMVSEDSALFRAHPDWALSDPGRKPMLARSQLVLDMGNEKVQEYLFERISDVLASTKIEYVKWDFNRGLANVYSNVLAAERQGEAAHRFVLGTYALLARLLARFPKLMIEGCAGGGGRFDAGMLYYCPQIWCSDDTDPIARLKIQRGTSYGYPVSAVGSHVSASPNHQTGRLTSLKTRGVVAMSGTFGYELDLAKLGEEEKEIVRQQIHDFHRYYQLIQTGSYYRLSDEEAEKYYSAWAFVSEDQSEILLNLVVTDVQANPLIPCIRLRGLDERAVYALEGADRRYTGAALMYGGFVVSDLPEEMLLGREKSCYPTVQAYLHRQAL